MVATTPARLVLATPVRAFVPDAFPSLANSRRTPRLRRHDNVFFGIDTFLYDCLDRISDAFFLAY
jgi:Mg2+ and Co2+ transporter CorA